MVGVAVQWVRGDSIWVHRFGETGPLLRSEVCEFVPQAQHVNLRKGGHRGEGSPDAPMRIILIRVIDARRGIPEVLLIVVRHADFQAAFLLCRRLRSRSGRWMRREILRQIKIRATCPALRATPFAPFQPSGPIDPGDARRPRGTEGGIADWEGPTSFDGFRQPTDGVTTQRKCNVAMPRSSGQRALRK